MRRAFYHWATGAPNDRGFVYGPREREFSEGFHCCLEVARCGLSGVLSLSLLGVTEGCLRTFALRLRTLHMPPGDTLIHPGGLLSSLFFVEHGSLEVLDPYDGAILAVLSVGDFFGGLPPPFSKHHHHGLHHSSPNGAFIRTSPIAAKCRFIVRALTYCDLHYLEREDLADLFHLYPELAENFVGHFELTIPLAGTGEYVTEAVSYRFFVYLTFLSISTHVYNLASSAVNYLQQPPRIRPKFRPHIFIFVL